MAKRNLFVRYAVAVALSFFAIGSSVPAAAQTSVPLTPQQEAFFPKNDPIDEKLWAIFSHPLMFAPEVQIPGLPVGSRYHVKFTYGTYDGVCLAWHTNQELWGGALVGSCATMKIHPKLPHPERFSFVTWHTLDPRMHLEIIRNLFLSVKPIELNDFVPVADPNFYWLKAAPIIKRLLERDGVRLADALIDFGDGHSRRIYALSLIPETECLEQDGSKGLDPMYLYAEGDDNFALQFNKRQTSLPPFFYEGQAYAGGDLGLNRLTTHKLGNGTYEFYSIPQCELQPKTHK